MVGLVALLVAAALAVGVTVGAGAAASAVPARGGGRPVRVLGLRAGTVIVAGTAREARRLRLRATVSIVRRVGSLSAQLNGHPIRLRAVRSGRVGVRLDAASGLVVGENLLWVSAGPRGRPPLWVVPVRFVVGYRDARALAVHLRLGAGTRPAATASLRVPSAGVEGLAVTLNGARVRVPAGARVLDLAQLGAVRWGSNSLRVRLIMLDGRVADWRRTFRLDRRRDVAIARLDGRAVVGRSVAMDARRSLIVSGVRRARGFRWVLLRRPRLSHARLGRSHGARITLRPDVPGHYLIALAVGRGSRPGGAISAAAGSSAASAIDLLNVSVTYPEPLVPLNTIKRNGDGTIGVQVGNSFYQDPSSSQVQLVVLRRDDLEEVNNEGFSAANNFTDLAAALRGLDPSELVIITYTGGYTPLPSGSVTNLNNALQQVGGSLPAQWTFSSGNCWSGLTSSCQGSWQHTTSGINPEPAPPFVAYGFTVIGVPTLTVGQAWRAALPQTASDAIVGYLTQGTPTETGAVGYYTVINGGSDQYAPVDTCAGSNCAVRIGVNVTGTTSNGSATITSVTSSNDYANGATIEGPGIPPGATIVSGARSSTLTISSPAIASATAIGLTVNQSYPPPRANGLHIMELDRATLTPYLNETVTTTSDLLSAFRNTSQNSFLLGRILPSPDTGRGSGCSQTLNPPPCGMDDQRLVIIQSVGNGQVSGTASTALLQYLDELGGTPDLLLGALSGQSKYALVGAATNLPWRNPSGLESSTGTPVIPNNSEHFQAGEISGLLELNRDGQYTPLAGDPINATNTALPQILYGPPQPWPYAQDTQELKYIADGIGLSAYPNVRSAYLDANLANSWQNELDDLKALTCSDATECGPNFDAVKTALELEFPWVPKVYQLATDLFSPYNSGAATYFDIAEVTSQVKNSLPPISDGTSTSMNWLSIMSDLMYVGSGIATAGEAEGLSTVLGLAGSAGNLATDVMQPDSKGSPAAEVITTAGQLAGQMAQQQTAYVDWLGTMQRIVLSDYGKLSAVGRAIGNDPAWTWTTGVTTPQAITALQANATASAFSALVPVAWPGYNLTPDFTSQTSSNNVSTYECGQFVDYPFAAAKPPNQFHAITSIATDGSAVDQVWTFGKLNSSQWGGPTGGSDKTVQMPSASETDYIYGPYATGHSQNGTYYYGAYQYGPEWWRNTYNAPGHTVCSIAPGHSFQYAPPSVSAPPP